MRPSWGSSQRVTTSAPPSERCTPSVRMGTRRSSPRSGPAGTPRSRGRGREPCHCSRHRPRRRSRSPPAPRDVVRPSKEFLRQAGDDAVADTRPGQQHDGRPVLSEEDARAAQTGRLSAASHCGEPAATDGMGSGQSHVEEIPGSDQRNRVLGVDPVEDRPPGALPRAVARIGRLEAQGAADQLHPGAQTSPKSEIARFIPAQGSPRPSRRRAAPACWAPGGRRCRPRLSPSTRTRSSSRRSRRGARWRPPGWRYATGWDAARRAGSAAPRGSTDATAMASATAVWRRNKGQPVSPTVRRPTPRPPASATGRGRSR